MNENQDQSNMHKIESAANIGGVVLSAALVVIQIVGLFRGRPITKI